MTLVTVLALVSLTVPLDWATVDYYQYYEATWPAATHCTHQSPAMKAKATFSLWHSRLAHDLEEYNVLKHLPKYQVSNRAIAFFSFLVSAAVAADASNNKGMITETAAGWVYVLLAVVTWVGCFAWYQSFVHYDYWNAFDNDPFWVDVRVRVAPVGAGCALQAVCGCVYLALGTALLSAAAAAREEHSATAGAGVAPPPQQQQKRTLLCCIDGCHPATSLRAVVVQQIDDLKAPLHSPTGLPLHLQTDDLPLDSPTDDQTDDLPLHSQADDQTDDLPLHSQADDQTDDLPLHSPTSPSSSVSSFSVSSFSMTSCSSESSSYSHVDAEDA